MPKDVSERIIDTPYSAPTPRGGATTIGGGGGGGAPTNLDALTDVTLSAPVNLQVLTYNSATGQWVNGASTAMTAHALSGPYHTGQLNWNLISFTGSSIADLAAHSHSLLTGIGRDDHHPHQHPLVGTDALGVAQHTATGLTTGNVVRATGATTFAWQQLQHTDLGNVLPDQHHTRAHDIITGDGSGPVHTVVGADFTVVGVHPANTLALLPTSSAPGAAVSILKTDSTGGIQLDTNLLYVNGANNWVGINVVPSGAALDIRASATGDITQRIRQIAGQTQRLWRVEDTGGNELIVLDSVGNLQSGRPGFVSGLTGWQITPQGNAEFNNIWARGELHATVFVKDEVHATGGTLLVASAGTLFDDAVIDSTTVDDDVLVVYSTPAGAGVPLQVVTTSGTFTGNELHVSWLRNVLNINDPPSGPGFYFQPGDIVRSKTEVATGVTDFWLEINSATQNSGYATYSVFKRSGTDGTLPKGSAVVSYGKQGDGRIMLTSDLNYAPYIDVFTVGPNVWTGDAGSVLPRMRMGRLDGIGLPGVSGVEQYGMIAGKDLSDANSGYLIASNLQFSLYKISIRVNDGTNDTGLWTPAGNLKLGKNIGTVPTTSFEVDTVTGDVYIGDRTATINPANPAYLYWNQTAGTLTIRGDLIVAGSPGSGFVTIGDAQLWDSQTKDYGNARRIIGVNGSWDSTAYNQVTWSGLAVVFANPVGVQRSIANPSAPGYITITGRTYLYVNMTGSGTMTLVPATSIATVSAADNVLVAVCDLGTSGASGTNKCTITVVAGTTYISGSNIFTGSIVAANIAAHTITANEILGNTITVTQIAPAYTGTITTAQATATNAAAAAANAQTDATQALTNASSNFNYAEARRVVGISGTWTVVNGNTISWSALSVKFSVGSARSIGPVSNYVLTPAGRHYLFINVTDGSLVLYDTTSLNSILTDNVLIAVVDTGTAKASINIVAGSTYISGDNILTGSIVSNRIAANTIVADRMSVGYLGDMNGSGVVRTGTLEIDSTSNLHSVGKTSYGGVPGDVAGFFIGYDGGYKINIGNAAQNIKWDGANLFIATSQAVQISNTASGQILNMSGPSSTTGLLTLEAGVSPLASNLLRSSADFIAPQIQANKFLMTGDTLHLKTPRVVTSAQIGPGALGFKGEICWGIDVGVLYLYLCYADNNWRRIQFPVTTW